MRNLYLLLLTTSVLLSQQLTTYVDPFIGTAGHGHTYPGVSMPFGMVQLSPDTGVQGWDWCSGYHASDSSIIGFSHTHLSGTGAVDYGDILLMPGRGEIHIQPGTKEDPDAGYRSRFRSETEQASPGYYAVHLDDPDIDVELTVTPRTGFHKYTFNQPDSAYVVLDLNHGLGPDYVLESYLTEVDSRKFEGLRRSQGWAKEQHVYFAIEFSQPIHDVAMNSELRLRGGPFTYVNPGAIILEFDLSANRPLMVKVGISAVDEAGAWKNLEEENPGWDFEAVRAQAESTWERQLKKIEVSGGTLAQRRTFYTALYHSFLSPNLFMDVDGRYRGMDRKIHEADGFTNYTVFSLWDTFRATHPLFTIVEPERTTDMVNSLLARYDEGGKLPIWELAGNYTGTMIGYHAIPVIADAYIKDIGGIDYKRAFEASKTSALDHTEGLELYQKRGYIPADRENESVSKALEYAYDDWCIAQMANGLGREADFAAFTRRSQYYRNHFHAESGFMRGRLSNGEWKTPFDPRFSMHRRDEYTEGNAWQYTWFVPHDVYGLIDLMGGPTGFETMLDSLFNQESGVTGPHSSPDISGFIGQYAHGNEPSQHIAYLYHYLGKPWKSQERLREIMNTLYSDKRDGLCGNEDCGQMSAWYVLNAMGFYSFLPGSDYYLLGAPLFDSVQLNLNDGQTFTLSTDNTPHKNPYLIGAELDGEHYSATHLSHADITTGGTLRFKMDTAPSESYGQPESDRPPSHSVEPITAVPIIDTDRQFFVDSLEIRLYSDTPDAAIFYTLNGSEPGTRSTEYKQTIVVTERTRVRAIAIKDGMMPSSIVETEFRPVPFRKVSKLVYPFSIMYTAGGEFGLVDGLRGSDRFMDGRWQGFEAVDLDVTIDLGQPEDISSISTSFLHDDGSWIFLPDSIAFSISLDGNNFTPLYEQDIPYPDRPAPNAIHNHTHTFDPLSVRYVRVYAKNLVTCPDWHKGAGGKNWVFIDEVVIE